VWEIARRRQLRDLRELSLALFVARLVTDILYLALLRRIVRVDIVHHALLHLLIARQDARL
jgi:hypothetical protein